MLDYWNVKLLEDLNPQQKESVARELLKVLTKDGFNIIPSPGMYDQYDATLTRNGFIWYAENKLRFIPEKWVVNGTQTVPPGLLVDLTKVEYMYNTGRGWIIQYLVEEEIAYIARVGKPSDYDQVTGMFPKNSYDGTRVKKTVCFIPVKDAERRIIDINGIMFNAARN